MVKKNKNRQLQESPISQAGDSAESCDQKKNVAGSLCPHIQKAVHLGSVKKALKNGCLASECPGCVKENFKPESEEDTQGTELWLCLQCGHQGCGRTHQQHALKHFKVVHSDPHCLAVNTTTWSIWCYDCEVKLDSEYRKKLHECVKYLRNLDYPSLRGSTKSNTSDASKETDTTDSSALPLSDVTNVPHGVRGAAKKRISVSLPRVRGLHNLGNTCFFNSVMQCLAQTPHFLELLQDMCQGGSKICLPGGKGLLKKPDTKPGDEADDDELPPLEVSLTKWGSLTEALTNTLEELRQDDATAVNPQRLFNKLTTKWPQFGGGDQHDAHELLRHLLDEVRTEDLKRYWTGILDEYGLSRHDTSETVDSSVRARVRAYGKQAGEQLLLPDPVFRGILVSTVECQDCLHSYQRTEPFYELSLPVTTNKPQPPVMRRKTGTEDSYDVCGNPASDTPSKHQLKKERRQQRKGRKKGQNSQNKNSPSLETMSETAIAEEPSCNTAESEQSDADVEDNIEQDTAIKKRNLSTEVLINGEVISPLDISLCNGDSSETELFVRSTKVVDRTVSENVCNGNSESSLELKVCNSFNSESRTIDGGQSQNSKDNESGTTISKEAIIDPVSKMGSSVSKYMDKDDLPDLKNLSVTENSFEVANRTSEIVENTCGTLNTSLKENGIPCEAEENEKGDNQNKMSWSTNGPSIVHVPSTQERRIDEENVNETNDGQTQSATCLEAVEPSEMSFQLMKDSFTLNKTNEELSLSISVGPNTPSALGSPVSNTGSPSSISSDMNVDLNHSNNLSPGNWMNDETDRPFSRIAFCNEEENVPNVEVSATVDGKGNDCMNRSPICDKEVLTADQLSKEMASLSLGHEDCQSPSHWDTCSAHSTEDTKDTKSLLPLEVSVCNGVSRSSDPETVDDGDRSATLAPRYHCGDKECSIESCLNQFTLLELMTGSCKVICESCSERINRGKIGKMVATNSTKQYLVSNPPAVLVLHLKRFELHQNVFRKTPRHVTFPTLLDIAPICNTKCRELPTIRKGQIKVLYSLYGVVQHSGTLHGGHYSAYVKVRSPVKRDDMRWCFLPTSQSSERLEELSKSASIPTEPVPGKWYHVSDSRVNEVNEDRVLHSQAYLLFYERVW